MTTSGVTAVNQHLAASEGSQRNVARVGISQLRQQAIFCSFAPLPLLEALVIAPEQSYTHAPLCMTSYVNSLPAKKRNGSVRMHLTTLDQRLSAGWR